MEFSRIVEIYLDWMKGSGKLTWNLAGKWVTRDLGRCAERQQIWVHFVPGMETSDLVDFVGSYRICGHFYRISWDDCMGS